MAILNENEKKKLVNLGHLEVYTQETKKYIENQNITVDSHIADIDALVQAEIINRAKADIEIESKISAETSRAELAEQGIKELVALEATQARLQENLIRQLLADSLSVEEENRNSAIYLAELRVDEKLASLYNVIGNDIATALVAVEGKLTAATNNITNALSTEVQARTSITTLLQELLTNEAALRVSEDNALRKSIDEHIVEYRLDSEALSSHIADLNNPHKVTPELIGAASQEDFNLLERRVVTVETESQENIARLNTAESNIQTINTTLGEVKSDITDLTVNKVAYEGNNQTISGGLISDGDLRINGNLIVNGTTTTKDTETSLIKDNFIILNSEGETLGTQLSGISIRTNSKDAYSIAYDITNDSVSLGQGVISNDGNFSFNQGESKPILTRDVSTNLLDGHLLVWDAQKNIAVDGGAYDLETLKATFTNWDAHNALVREVRNNDDDILALQNKDSETDNIIAQILIKNQDLDNVISQHQSALAALDNNKQNKSDTALNTKDQTIVGAINELDNALHLHETDVNNPHNVTWDQINSQALNNSVPLMAGTANAGSSTYVARLDHIHPTDTSRAPVEHTFTDVDPVNYGKATAAVYGHVKYSSDILNDEAGVVSAKLLKDYVANEINKLDVTEISCEPGEYITGISLTDGKVNATVQKLTVEQALVTGLVDLLSNIEGIINVDNNSNLLEIIDTLRKKDSGLSNSITGVRSDISELNSRTSVMVTLLNTEIQDRTAADTAIAVQAQTNLDLAKADLLSLINSLLLLDTNVKLTGPMLFTKTFGKYTPDSTGSVSVGSEGMTIRELFLDAFSEQSAGTTDLPSYSYSAGSNQTGEVGSSYTLPTATFKVIDVGSYLYGPETGITFYGNLTSDIESVSNVTYTGLTTNDTITISGSGVTDTFKPTTTTYTFGGSYSYTGGVAPNTNLGGTDLSRSIVPLSNLPLSCSVSYTGYYKMFMGVAAKSSGFTSDEIRALSKVSAKEAKGANSFTVKAGDLTIVVALRADYTQAKPTLQYEALGSWYDLDWNLTTNTVLVKDGGGINATQYYIYTYTPASGAFEADSTNIKVTVK